MVHGFPVLSVALGSGSVKHLCDRRLETCSLAVAGFMHSCGVDEARAPLLSTRELERAEERGCLQNAK